VLKNAHGKRLVARLVVFAVVAMLVIPAGAASAATAACPASTPSAGFTDLTGLSAAAIEAINCIKFYGITAGTSATTYSPNDDVLRYQMAIFIIRSLQADGLGMPSGASQGFTDISGLTAAQQTAINQLKQLGISTGTTATTFSPLNSVLRYEMAVFMVRAAAAAGVALPSGADQGFTDIGSLTAAQQTMVNQLKQLGITAGTSATTYSPHQAVPRWQMALFIAALLQVMGVTPAGIGVLAVSPTTAASLTVATPEGTSDDRTYTASGLTAGTTYNIHLVPAANVTVSGSTVTFADVGDDSIADGTTAASAVTGADIINVNGSAIVAADDALATPVSGNISFVVDGVGAGGSFIPVVWIDGGADGLNLNATNNPIEAFGLGGTVTYTPAEFAGGAFGATPVVTTDKSADVWTSGAPASFFYDANDTFTVDGVPSTLAAFEAALSSGDTVSGTYAPDAAAVSTFNLLNINPAVAGPAAPVLTLGANQVTVTWTPVTPLADLDSFNIYRALSVTGTDCTSSPVYSVIASSTDLTAPHNYIDTTVATPEEYCYRTAEVNDGDEGALSPASFVATASDPAPRIVNSKLATDGGLVGVADSGDIFKFAFSEVMAAAVDTDVTTSFRAVDGDGSTIDVLCAVAAGCTLNIAIETVDGVDYAIGRVLTVTTVGGATITPVVGFAGTIAGFQYPGTVTNVSATWDDTTGNQLDLAGSTDKIIG